MKNPRGLIPTLPIFRLEGRATFCPGVITGSRTAGPANEMVLIRKFIPSALNVAGSFVLTVVPVYVQEDEKISTYPIVRVAVVFMVPTS